MAADSVQLGEVHSGEQGGGVGESCLDHEDAARFLGDSRHDPVGN
jgi:hypothetical protein